MLGRRSSQKSSGCSTPAAGGSAGIDSGPGANLILRKFEAYLEEFLVVTRRARRSFEQRDWRGARRDALERLGLYEKALSQISVQLESLYGPTAGDGQLWADARGAFARLVADRPNRDLAETFFNSVTRKMLNTVGIDRAVEFFHRDAAPPAPAPSGPVFARYRHEKDTATLIRRVIEDHAFNARFEDLERDLGCVSAELDLALWPFVRRGIPFELEVLHPCFFRNRVAYVVGRIAVEDRTTPMILPIYNDTAGLFIDSVILDEADANNIFGFAYSPFQVDVDVPREVVRFLASILPRRPISDLYNAIGYPRHGKTVFYRNLHRVIHLSRERFTIAPGREGAVMIVFTLPSSDYVFKVIKDRPCFLRSVQRTAKEISRAEVRRRYRFVCDRDRVGRLVDTQEFENLRFKVRRYEPGLLSEFRLAATGSVHESDGYVIVDHAYLQRRVTPLPTYFLEETDTAQIRRVVVDFGYFIKDLAAAGLFPADLFNTWNYGVTEGRRVVLFDYDDVVPLEDVHFLRKPGPRDEFEETHEDAEWLAAGPCDFFLDELGTFLGIPDSLRGTFCGAHRDLFTLDYWRSVRSRVAAGEIIDIIPYDRSKRFRRSSREV